MILSCHWCTNLWWGWATDSLCRISIQAQLYSLELNPTACGIIPPNRQGFPHTLDNGMSRHSDQARIIKDNFSNDNFDGSTPERCPLPSLLHLACRVERMSQASACVSRLLMGHWPTEIPLFLPQWRTTSPTEVEMTYHRYIVRLLWNEPWNGTRMC